MRRRGVAGMTPGRCGRRRSDDASAAVACMVPSLATATLERAGSATHVANGVVVFPESGGN